MSSGSQKEEKLRAAEDKLDEICAEMGKQRGGSDQPMPPSSARCPGSAEARWPSCSPRPPGRSPAGTSRSRYDVLRGRGHSYSSALRGVAAPAFLTTYNCILTET